MVDPATDSVSLIPSESAAAAKEIVIVHDAQQ
jgi:hypothetical protein